MDQANANTGYKLKDLTTEKLTNAISKKLDKDGFVVMNKGTEYFLQAAPNKAGSYFLEYREGGNQYRSKKLLRREEVLARLIKYVKEDDSWKSELSWELIQIKPGLKLFPNKNSFKLIFGIKSISIKSLVILLIMILVVICTAFRNYIFFSLAGSPGIKIIPVIGSIQYNNSYIGGLITVDELICKEEATEYAWDPFTFRLELASVDSANDFRIAKASDKSKTFTSIGKSDNDGDRCGETSIQYHL